MRAGAYAEVDGHVYPVVSLHKPAVRLLAFGPQPPDPAFEDEGRGRWSRLVDRSAASRLFSVETTARWQGHDVVVQRVEGDTAVWSYDRDDLPTDPRVSRIDRFEWQGQVPVAELTDAVEVEHEVAL
ncbi:hypothetical protein [Cellulomonas septica]|uniref:RES domain-containing protein n=1 Tax=Cellulomonas septica TaxID=285080 RepID=A0ABX1K4G5_9CELL|nr:hypothetical protein [Cellulomonas septica]NKY40852.1 hypothetical protein [Cellulomonas septica]